MSYCVLVESLWVHNLLCVLHVLQLQLGFSMGDPTFGKITFATHTHVISIKSRYFIVLLKSDLKYISKV